MDDLNIDMLHHTQKPRNLRSVLQQHGPWRQLIQQPTSRRGALIVYICTNTSALAVGVTTLYCSDHDIIWAAIRVPPEGNFTPAAHPGHTSQRAPRQ